MAIGVIPPMINGPPYLRNCARGCAETRRERDEGDGATTGDREDTPSTLRMELPDPDGSMNDGGRAGGTTVPVSRQEGGEPAKKER